MTPTSNALLPRVAIANWTKKTLTWWIHFFIFYFLRFICWHPGAHWVGQKKIAASFRALIFAISHDVVTMKASFLSFAILLVPIHHTSAFHVRKATLRQHPSPFRNSAERLRDHKRRPSFVSLNTDLPSSAHDDETVPFILKPWIFLYRSLPKIHVPFTKGLDFSFTIVSALFLTCIDYASAHYLFNQGWPQPETRKLAGSITTIVHSTCLTLGLGACLSTQPYKPSHKMNIHPDWWQDAATSLIQFCTGYMIYDAAVQFIADRWQHGVGLVLSTVDWLFLGHHLATSMYMTSARLIQAGHMSAMILMFFGEITAPIMNVLRITNILTELEYSSRLLQIWRPRVEYLFALAYVFFRTVVGPFLAVHLTYDLLLTKEGRSNVPIGLSLVWLSMVWIVLLGSWPWIQRSIKILRGVSMAVL